MIMVLGFLFAMVEFTLLLMTQGHSMLGFTLITEGQIWEKEAASVAFAQLQGVLQGDVPPSSVGLASTSGGAFNGTSSDVVFDGTLTVQPPGPAGGPESYTTTSTASGISVPSSHALAMLTARVDGSPGTPAGTWLCMDLAAFPYALLAPSGNIQVQSVRSTGNLDGDDSHVIGLMGNLFASGSVTVTGQLNGRAYAAGSVSIGQGGIIYPQWPNAVSIPADFAAQLGTWKTQVQSGLTDISGKFNDLHTALHQDFSADEAAAYAAAELAAAEMGGTLDSPLDVYGGADTTQATVNSPGSTDTDSGTLKIGVSLRIPSGESDELNFSTVNIQNGDLLLEDNTVLHVKGDLVVGGAIRLGQQASLVVDGSTQAQSIEPTYAPAANYVSIRSCVYGIGGITLTGGMQQTSVQWIPQLPTTTSNPYPSTLDFSVLIPDDPAFDSPDSCENPASVDFDARQAADMATLTGADQIQNYLVQIVPTGVPTTASVPGVFLVSDSSLTAGNCSKMAGLFVASGISMPNTTRIVGAAWATSGDVTLTGSDVRYFPYWTHVFAQTSAGPSSLAAVHHHSIARGQIP